MLTSTRRLARIDERTDFDTSPFLLGFIPPLYLTPAGAGRGAHAAGARAASTEDETATVMQRTANHPFLLQLIASRLFESRDLAATLDQVAADEMVSNFFSVDFQTLDAHRAAARGGGGARGRPHAQGAGAGGGRARTSAWSRCCSA